MQTDIATFNPLSLAWILYRQSIFTFYMRIWLTIVIIVIAYFAGIITIPILIAPYQSQLKILGQAKDLLQYTPTVILVLTALINWIKGSALEIGKIIREPSSYSTGGVAYVLEVKRRWGKYRPQGCQGHLKIEKTDIREYTIWGNHRRHIEIGDDECLALFEISDSQIIFHFNDTDEIENLKNRKMLYEKVKDNKIMLVIDAENTKKLKPYKKKIKDIIKDAKTSS